jgi:uncharacterized protein
MPIFAVITAKNVNWDRGRDIREQAFWDEHAAFMDRLVDRGVVVMGGPIDSGAKDDIALMAVEAPDEGAARSLFDTDPWLVHELFRIKSIWPWTIWMDRRS